MRKKNSAFSLLKTIWRNPIARISTSLLILGLLLTRLPLSELWDTIRQVSFFLWGLALVAFISGHVVGSIKWSLLVNIGKQRLGFWEALRFHFAGLFANLFLPSLAGGDVVRAGMAIRSTKDKESVILGGLLDRFLDTSALGAIILFGAALTPGTLASQDRTVLLWVFGILSIFPLGGLFLLITPLPQRIPKKLSVTVIRVRELIRHLIRTPMRAIVGFAMAICVQAGFVLLNAFLGKVCGIDLPLPIWFLAWPLAKLSAMLPITMGGIGVREVALAAFLGRFDVPFSKAVGFGLVWETILVTGGAIGGISYFLFGRNVSKADTTGAGNQPIELSQKKSPRAGQPSN